METKKLNIIIETGFDFVMPITLYDYNNAVMDLTGSYAEASLRQYPEAKDSFPFETTHNNSGGRITLKMPHYITEEIPFSSGVYDVKVTFPNGRRFHALHGEAVIISGVTR